MGVIENKIAIKKLSKSSSGGPKVVYLDTNSVASGAEGIESGNVTGLGVKYLVTSSGDIPTYLYHDKEMTQPVTREEFVNLRNNMFVDTFAAVETFTAYGSFSLITCGVYYASGQLNSITYTLLSVLPDS